MKFAILALAAAGGLAVSTGSALAGPPGHGHYHGGYGNRYHPPVPHLDYHRGHYHYHDGFYRSPPLVPAYPRYNYGYSNYGAYPYGARSGFNITIGSGYGGYSRPYYGGFGPRW